MLNNEKNTIHIFVGYFPQAEIEQRQKDGWLTGYDAGDETLLKSIRNAKPETRFVVAGGGAGKCLRTLVIMIIQRGFHAYINLNEITTEHSKRDALNHRRTALLRGISTNDRRKITFIK